MATYTAWGEIGMATCLVPGEEPPKTLDGTPINDFEGDCPDLIWTIEANSWDEAMIRYHELQGWEPYQPMRLPETISDTLLFLHHRLDELASQAFRQCCRESSPMTRVVLESRFWGIRDSQHEIREHARIHHRLDLDWWPDTKSEWKDSDPETFIGKCERCGKVKPLQKVPDKVCLEDISEDNPVKWHSWCQPCYRSRPTRHSANLHAVS